MWAELQRLAPSPATGSSPSETVFATTVEGVLARCPEAPYAIVASGSFGRGEETVVWQGNAARILGDAEFYVIFTNEQHAKAFRDLSDGLESDLQDTLAEKGVPCPVSFATPSKLTLQKTPPNLLSYELRTTGRVLWGDRSALELIPPFTPREIPKWDAWRSVANRMIEHLACTDALDDEREPSHQLTELLYSCLKLQLELGAMVLHFQGAFEPTYRGRAQALDKLASGLVRQQPAEWLRSLVSRVALCTRFKLDTSTPSVYRDVLREQGTAATREAQVRQECREATELAYAVWRWGAEQLLKQDLHHLRDPIQVGLMVARAQSWSWRLRGWTRLGLVEAGWKDPGYWARLVRLAPIGGPRFLTYAVGAALYLDWGRALDDSGISANARARQAMRYFPFGPVPDTSFQAARDAVVEGWSRYLKTSWA